MDDDAWKRMEMKGVIRRDYQNDFDSDDDDDGGTTTTMGTREDVVPVVIFVVVVVPCASRKPPSFVFRSSFVWIEKYLSSESESARASILITIDDVNGSRSLTGMETGMDDGYREGKGWNTIEGCVPRVEGLGSMCFRHRTRTSTRREDGWTRARAKEK